LGADSQDGAVKIGKAEKLLSVPEALLIDSHYFNCDPAALLEVRREIARMIEALGE